MSITPNPTLRTGSRSRHPQFDAEHQSGIDQKRGLFATLFIARMPAGGNSSDLMCPSYSKLVIPGLTRNPETFATSDLHYHWHFWIPACEDLCVTFRDSRESENPECAQIRGTPSP